MRRLLPLLLVLACGPGIHRNGEFRDGAPVEHVPVFVAPGYTPVGAGLPEYMPVEEEPKAPRGTDRRVLPPTREPRIYASDAPQAASLPPALDSWPDPAVLLGTPLPYPIVMNTSEDRYFARQCAHVVGDFKKHVGVNVDALPVLEKRCLAARMYVMCMRWVDRPPVNTDPHFRKMIDASKARASAFAKDACEDEPKSPEADAFLRGLELHLRRIK